MANCAARKRVIGGSRPIFSTRYRPSIAAPTRHADLNAKNLHMAREAGRWHAWVLDVDRVGFLSPNHPDVGQQNFDRLERSIRKWRDRGSLSMTDATLNRLSALAEGRA